MEFQPVAHRGSWISLAVAGVSLAVGIGLTRLLRQQEPSALFFWLGLFALMAYGLFLYFAYLALALFRLAYFISRNGLSICFGAIREQIPIKHILNILPADKTSIPKRRILGFNLPPWWVGTWAEVSFYTTTRPEASLRVQTDQGDFLISPLNPQAFIEAWQQRRPLGPTQFWLQETRRWPFFNLPFWFDPFTWRLAGGAVLIWLILIGSILFAYPNWPRNIPIGFDITGQVTTIVPRQQFLWLPAIGGAILILNLILGAVWYRQERLAAYLIWFIAVLVQIGLWVGIRMLVG